MRCPACGGSQYVVDAPNMLRCTSQALVSTIPPGMGANLTGGPVPVYGECRVVGTEAEWRAAAKQADRYAAKEKAKHDEQQRFEQERSQLEKRQATLLRELNARGNPGVQSRQVPGRYRLSFMAKLMGRVGTDELVEVAPAWSFGKCTWESTGMRGVDISEELRSGITPRGKIVPMDYAAKDDPVEVLYRKRTLKASSASVQEIVRALEKASRL